jgi:hypothetical protein
MNNQSRIRKIRSRHYIGEWYQFLGEAGCSLTVLLFSVLESHDSTAP